MLIVNLNLTFISNIMRSISWLKSVLIGLLETILDNWLLSGFLYCCIAFVSICIVIDFIQDGVEMTNEFAMNSAQRYNRESKNEYKRQLRMSENQKRYEERRKENRAYAEELYRQREADRRKYNEELYNKRNNIIEHKASYDIQKTIEEDNTKDIVYKKKTKSI